MSFNSYETSPSFLPLNLRRNPKPRRGNPLPVRLRRRYHLPMSFLSTLLKTVSGILRCQHTSPHSLPDIFAVSVQSYGSRRRPNPTPSTSTASAAPSVLLLSANEADDIDLGWKPQEFGPTRPKKKRKVHSAEDIQAQTEADQLDRENSAKVRFKVSEISYGDEHSVLTAILLSKVSPDDSPSGAIGSNRTGCRPS